MDNIHSDSGFFNIIPMNDFKAVSDIINEGMKNYSFISVLISSAVFITYTLIVKLIDYFKSKDSRKPLIEMSEVIKEVSNNVVKLNMILDKVFQETNRKEAEKCKNVIELVFNNFLYKLSNLSRNIIINNNIEENKELIISNVSRHVNAEYYKIHYILLQYEANNIPLSMYLKKEWIDDTINDIVDIIYNGKDFKTRITQINNSLNAKVNDWVIYINNKYIEHE